jgi:tetratricopeptide (TPR) repeat protein
LAQSSPPTAWSATVYPELDFPIGNDKDYFGLGGGGGLGATTRIPFLPFLYAGGNLGYSYLSTKASGRSVSAIDLGAQAGVHFQISRSLFARAGGELGYFMASSEGSTNFNPYFQGGAELGFDLSPRMGLSLGGYYRNRYALVGELAASLGVRYRLGAGKAKEIELPRGYTPLKAGARGLGFVGARLDSVFPVFFKHYDDHSFGTLAIHNFESVAASDIKATVEVKRYMDEPKSAVVPLEIGPGETGEMQLYGLFTDKILEIVEATKLPISIKLRYDQYGKTYTDEYVATLSVLDRNAITWDDDRKAAAFISAKDPSVLAFSKSAASSTRALRSPGVNENLQAAMAIHEALRVQGLTYVRDPASALETNSKQVVDFIQFPQQTLGFGSGKCGDLTVVYCSMLEAIGVTTALITVPGHILMAADLEMPPDMAARTFLNPGDLIVKDGTVWLPIETTMRTEGFVKAWQEGARQWNANTAKGAAAFYPVHEAWKAYQPVVFSGAAPVTGQRDPGAGARSFQGELAAFIASETGPRVAAIQAQIKKGADGASGPLLNNLGVLYARYGLYDKAAEQFKAALKTKNPGGSVFNMGNILFIQGRYAEALGYYSQAQAAAPYDPKIILAGTRANAALGNYDVAFQSYTVLKSLNPELASKYAYLGGDASSGTRAAEAAKTNGDVLWQD